MNLRNPLIKLSGYDPKILDNEPREAIHGLTLLGAAIGWAAAVAAVTWGIAAASIFDTWIAAVPGALVGAGLVISIDRAAVYTLDSSDPGWVRIAILYLVRFVLIFLISGISSDYLNRRAFWGDSAVIALAQRERNERERAQWLPQQFHIDGLRAALKEKDSVVIDATSAVDLIPSDVQSQSDQANACWATYAARKRSLATHHEMRRQVANLSARCNDLSASARKALEAYRESAKKKLTEAQDAQRDARASLADAEAAVSRKLADADKIEAAGITPNSDGVVDAAVTANPTAKRRWWNIFGTLLILECLPLILKAASRRSSIGMGILVDEALRVNGHVCRRDDALHSAQLRKVFREAWDEASADALNSEDVQAHLRQSAARYIEAFSSLDCARRLAADLEEMHEQRRAAIRRCPDIIEQLNAVFDSAFEDIVTHVTSETRSPRASAMAAE